MADETPAPSDVPDPTASVPAESPTPGDTASTAEPALDPATASFDSVADATSTAPGDGGSTPAIDEAALQELLTLANMEPPAGAAGHSSLAPDALGDLTAQSGAADFSAAATGGALPDAQQFDLPDFQRVIADAAASSIDLLRDVELNVKIELGRSRMLVEDVLKLSEGSVVELDKLAGDPVDVFVNERLVARGEVLVLNDNFCVRVNEIVAGARDDAA